ncbi:hypothetical protein BOX15_Mlig033326g4, partial [Macrostomum lignano]
TVADRDGATALTSAAIGGLETGSPEWHLLVTYLEDVLDCCESLPGDLQACLSQYRELDARCHASVADLERLAASSNSSESSAAVGVSVQRAVARLQELGEEKMRLAGLVQELLDGRRTRLDDGKRNLLARIEAAAAAARAASPASSTQQQQRRQHHQKRASAGERRRSAAAAAAAASDKDEAASSNASSSSRDLLTSVGGGAAAATATAATSSKRRRVRQQQQQTPASAPKKRQQQQSQQKASKSQQQQQQGGSTNEESRRYCICNKVSFGEMIACDNARCAIEWFHFRCVKLTSEPKGKWYCPDCRKDKQKKA